MLRPVGRLPDAVAACVGGGSNAIGIFHAFLDDADVRLFGFEAGGDGVETGRHARDPHRRLARRAARRASYLLQDEDGQTIESHSISAGLDYPGVGPEHAWLHDTGRATYRPVTDAEAMDAFAAAVPHRGHHPGDRVARTPSPARCSSARSSGPDAVMLVNLSGRGDKDMDTAAQWFGLIDEDVSAEDASGTAIADGGQTSWRQRVFAKPKADDGPRWSATCRPASRPSTGRHRSCCGDGRGRRRHASRSACPTATR